MRIDASRESQEPDGPPFRRGLHLVALAAAAFTLPLLYVGGSVTTYRVGLAVPDWPTTFGINMFLYEFWNAPFGVRVEHTHRLYGAAVGLFTVLLAAWFLIFERRKWLKGLGVLALAAVIVQGVLGGTRVTEVSTFLAAVHGAMGQAFFGLMVALCVLTGRNWQNDAAPEEDTGGLRLLALLALALVAAQIVLGSWLRHYGTLPALFTHAVFAMVVWLAGMVLWLRIERQRASLAALVPAARALGIASALQIVLGVVALVYLLPFDGTPRSVSFYQAVARTGHQTNGALLLGASVVLYLRAVRHLAGSATGARLDGGASRARPPESAVMDWEAVA
jgi:cytochrome c oxidase assembly protein subunit 15